MVPIAVAVLLWLWRLPPTTAASSASALASALPPPTNVADGRWWTDDDRGGHPVGLLGPVYHREYSSSTTSSESESDGGVVPGLLHGDDNSEEKEQNGDDDGGGGRDDVLRDDVGGGDGADDVETIAVPAGAEEDAASISDGSLNSYHGAGATSVVEFNQHLLVEVDVAIVEHEGPWKRTSTAVEYDIPLSPAAHTTGSMMFGSMFGAVVKNGAVGGGGSGSGTIGGGSARGAAWSGDRSSSSSSSSSSGGGGGGSGWAVTLEEVVFAPRHSSSQLERMKRMERQVWPKSTGGSSPGSSAASASTSFLLPLNSLRRRYGMAGNQAGNGHDEPIDHTSIQDVVLRASLVEIIPSAEEDGTVDRRVAMVRLVPVPLTEDGRLNHHVIGVHLNGTASAHPPAHVGEDPRTASATTSSWGSMMITAAAAVAVGVATALCFWHMYPANVDEYDYYQQEQMEQEERIHYMYAHPDGNEAGAEAVEEMTAMVEVHQGGVEANMPISDAADAAASQEAGEDEQEGEQDETNNDDGMASPPDVRRKMTADDLVGIALSTPVRTPVKEQPITSGLGELPSPGSPIQQDGTVEESMPLPDDGSVQHPQVENPYLDHGADDTSGVALFETNGIDEQGPGSGGQRSASAEEQYRSSSDGFGLTLGQRSFCSDSSAASASSIETHLHANWKQSQSQSQAENDPAPTANTAPRSNTSIAASSPTRSTSSSIAAEAGNMTTMGDATTERQNRQPRRRPRQLPSQNAPLFVEKRLPKHRKVEVKPLPAVGASRRLKKEEKKWDDSRYKFGATTSAGGSLASSKDRSASTNKAPSIAKSDSSKSSSKRKRKTSMPLASISVPSDVNAKKQRKST